MVRVFASDSCAPDSPSWAVRTDHFGSWKFSVDALLESFDSPLKIPTSNYAGGQFSIKIPPGLNAMVTAGGDGSGNSILIKGTAIYCQSVDPTFINREIVNKSPALVVV